MSAGLTPEGPAAVLRAVEVLGPAALKSLVVLALAWVVARLALRRSAALRHLVWLAALGACLALPLAETSLPESVRMDARPVAGAVVEGLRSVAGLVESPVPGAPTVAAGDAEAVGPAAAATRGPGHGGAGEPAGQLPGSLVVAGALLWLAGTLVVLLRTGWGLARLAAIRGRARPVDPGRDLPAGSLGAGEPGRLPELRVSPEVTLPVVQGLVRPSLLLPQEALEEWSAGRTRAVLLHEVGHVRRRDLASHLLGRLACALYWFNPMVWWAAREARREQERACDDLVVRAGHRPSSYARHLLDIAREGAGSAAPAGLSMARWPDLEGRVVALLREDADRRPARRGSLAGTGVPALALVLALGTVSLGGAGEPPADSGRTEEPGAGPTAAADSVPGGALSPTVGASSVTEHGELARLVAALESRSARVRKDAAHELGEAEDPAALPALERALRSDPSLRVRKTAAWAIGESETPEAVRILTEVLDEGVESRLERAIVRALGETEHPAAVPVLDRALGHGDRRTRWKALEALVENRTEPARALLARALEGDDPELRELAQRVLEKEKGRKEEKRRREEKRERRTSS